MESLSSFSGESIDVHSVDGGLLVISKNDELLSALGLALSEELGSFVRICICRHNPFGQDNHEVQRQLKECIGILKQQAPSKNLCTYEEMSLERIAYAVDISVARQMCASLMNEQELLFGHLFETMNECFNEKFNLSNAARKLFIHRNTLLYRIEKIKKLTGLDIRSFEQGATLRLMVILAKRVMGEGL